MTHETPIHVFYEGFFEGQRVRFYKNKFTNEIYVNSEDCARVLGYADTQDMMSDDRVLDAANEIHKRTGKFPIESINF